MFRTEDDQINDEGVPRLVFAQIIQTLWKERDSEGKNVEGLAAQGDVFLV